MFNLHATIPLPQHAWGEPVRQATDELHAKFPTAQTKVYGGSLFCRLIVDLTGLGAPTAALSAIQRLSAMLNPQGLTCVEVGDYGTVSASWIGYYAYGPSSAVAAWLAEQAAFDARLLGPVSLHLRYEETPA